LSRLLLAPRAAAEALTLAATGAPRATVAVLAAATLILACSGDDAPHSIPEGGSCA